MELLIARGFSYPVQSDLAALQLRLNAQPFLDAHPPSLAPRLGLVQTRAPPAAPSRGLHPTSWSFQVHLLVWPAASSQGQHSPEGFCCPSGFLGSSVTRKASPTAQGPPRASPVERGSFTFCLSSRPGSTCQASPCEDRGQRRSRGSEDPRGAALASGVKATKREVVLQPGHLRELWLLPGGGETLLGRSRHRGTGRQRLGGLVYSRHGHSVSNKKVRHSGTFL